MNIPCARSLFAASCLVAACFFALRNVRSAEEPRGSGRYFKVDYPASTTAGELQVAVTYTVWIPDGVLRLRGLIVHQHGAGTTASIEGLDFRFGMTCIGRLSRRNGTARCWGLRTMF